MLAGFVLVAVGAACLYLSDAVVRAWWQGTLDAFGVGFIVGKLVDVLAISGLNQVLAADQRRRELNFEAEEIVRGLDIRPHSVKTVSAFEAKASAAKDLLNRGEDQIEPHLREPLRTLVDFYRE